MAIPDFQTIMLPLLQIAGDEQEHSVHEFTDRLASHFSLSEAELVEMLPSGKQTTFYNRVGWARTYLSKSGLLEMSRRSYYRITGRGKQVLNSKPARIDMKFLEQFPEYIDFRDREGGRSCQHRLQNRADRRQAPGGIHDRLQCRGDGGRDLPIEAGGYGLLCGRVISGRFGRFRSYHLLVTYPKGLPG